MSRRWRHKCQVCGCGLESDELPGVFCADCRDIRHRISELSGRELPTLHDPVRLARVEAHTERVQRELAEGRGSC